MNEDCRWYLRSPRLVLDCMPRRESETLTPAPAPDDAESKA